MSKAYEEKQPPRAEVDALQGPTLIEFGNAWCGHCRRVQPLLEAALLDHPGVRHLKLADASGRRLGRSFRVKLWPTLVFMNSGKVLARLVRPADAGEIRRALEAVEGRR